MYILHVSYNKIVCGCIATYSFYWDILLNHAVNAHYNSARFTLGAALNVLRM